MSETETMQPCAWCGEPTTGKREVERQLRVPKTDELKKRAIVVPACEKHARIVDREEAIRATRRTVKRLQKHRERDEIFSREELTRAEAHLAELEKRT
jgi:hypothetical protein